MICLLSPVAIPTYDREEMFVRLLNSIIGFNYPKDRLEIVIVDDASGDGINEFVKNFMRELHTAFESPILYSTQEQYIVGLHAG